MGVTWTSEPPAPVPIGPLGWLRVVVRGVPLVLLLGGGLLFLLLIRLVEKPVHGLHRPWTPWITQAVCRTAFALLGIAFVTRGTPMRAPGAVVANHSSWLDILALNARKRVYFVSKAEVAGWPGIGWLAKATGTVFIERVARAAGAQRVLFRERLLAGHKLLFFPEGTSTDGRRVLDFKSSLYAAFFDHDLRDVASIQPVCVIYHAPPGADPRFYGWWGDMALGPHLVQVLAALPQGRVEVVYLPPVKVADFADRKALSAETGRVVREALTSAQRAAR